MSLLGAKHAPEIVIFVNGKQHAMRHSWIVVPEKGEQIDLHDDSTVVVCSRRFGDYGDNSMSAGQQIIHLYCEWVKAPKGKK